MRSKKYDPNNNSLLINVNRQISREIEQNQVDANDNRNEASSVSQEESPRFNYNSTLNKRQQSWVDPLEPRIQDTFYHKDLDTLRPRYSLLLKVMFTDMIIIIIIIYVVIPILCVICNPKSFT